MDNCKTKQVVQAIQKTEIFKSLWTRSRLRYESSSKILKRDLKQHWDCCKKLKKLDILCFQEKFEGLRRSSLRLRWRPKIFNSAWIKLCSTTKASKEFAKKRKVSEKIWAKKSPASLRRKRQSFQKIRKLRNKLEATKKFFNTELKSARISESHGDHAQCEEKKRKRRRNGKVTGRNTESSKLVSPNEGKESKVVNKNSPNSFLLWCHKLIFLWFYNQHFFPINVCIYTNTKSFRIFLCFFYCIGEGEQHKKEQHKGEERHHKERKRRE